MVFSHVIRGCPGGLFQVSGGEPLGSSWQGHADSKTLLQQNPPVLNWEYWLMQTDLYAGHKIVVFVVAPDKELWGYAAEDSMAQMPFQQ